MKILSSSRERKLKSKIPLRFKEFLADIVTSQFIGYLIKFFNPKFNLFNGFYDYKNLSNKEAALIFFGIWESAEIKFSKRFIDTQIIVELGSSIGVTLGVLGKNLKNVKFICVEASPRNFLKLKNISNQLPKCNEYNLINKAISYSKKKKIIFSHSSTSDGKIINNLNKNIFNSKNTFEVETITLSKLIRDFKIKTNYSLITDIEGFEADIFFKDKKALKYCNIIVAEIENSDLATIEQQVKKILSMKFIMIERYGNVMVFKRY